MKITTVRPPLSAVSYTHLNYRQVQLGSLVDGERVIEDGLKVGEKVVVNGLQRIRPGAVVAPQLAEKVATAQ